MQNYAAEYIYYVYNFRNGSLLFQRLLYEAVYGYAFFLIAYCARRRYFAVPILFLKAMLSTVYVCILISVGGFAGTLVAIFIFIPSALVSLFLNVLLLENCFIFNKKFAPFFPLVLAVADVIVLALLLNVLFRVVILIA